MPIKVGGAWGQGVGFWLLFTFFLSLLQAWVLMLVKVSGVGNVDPTRMLSDGSIIFCANTLAMKAVEEKCGFLIQLIRNKDQRAFTFFSLFLRRLGAGAIVLVVSVILYCGLLWSPSIEKKEERWKLEAIEVGLLGISLFVSLYEAIDNEKNRQDPGGPDGMKEEVAK